MIGFIRNKPFPARRYLVLLVLPPCLMLLLTVAVLWPCLANFRTTVKTLRDVRLPAILEAQRTRTNLSMLRKHLVIIYLAEAPLERRRARLHAQALLAGMAHDPSPVATEVLALGPRIRQLYVSRMEADKSLSRLHRHEMEMMLALNSLEQATGRKMAGEVIFSHTGRDGARHGRMAFEKMQRLLAPVEQMCAGSEDLRPVREAQARSGRDLAGKPRYRRPGPRPLAAFGRRAAASGQCGLLARSAALPGKYGVPFRSRGLHRLEHLPLHAGVAGLFACPAPAAAARPAAAAGAHRGEPLPPA